MQGEARQLLSKFLNAGFLRSSKSPFAAPMMLIPKKTPGQWRIVFDFRALNAITVKDRHAIPRSQELFDTLYGSRIYSTFDLQDGYYHMRIREEDIAKTAVTTPFGHYEWVVMPMGLCNAPATFQRFVNHAFAELVHQWSTLKVYLDDCLVHTADYASHVRSIRRFFELCQQHHIRLKSSKAYYCQTEVEFLGYTIKNGTLTPAQHLLEAIRIAQPPQSISPARSFRGLVGFYRKLIPQFARIAAPIIKLTKKEEQCCWDSEQQQAFVRLKEIFLHGEPPIVRIFDPEKPIRVHTDASNHSLGGCLSQLHGKTWHPVAFHSQVLNPAQRRYSTTGKETLAVISCLRKWKFYLQGQHFKLFTDHIAIQYLKTKNAEQLTRVEQGWIDILSQFDYTPHYEPGPRNIVADAISRWNTYPTLNILELCAGGTGTLLHALAAELPDYVRVSYYAVEKDLAAANSLKSAFAHVQKLRPHTFLGSVDNVNCFGSTLIDLKQQELPCIHLLFAGVPCQPFSRVAKNNAKGLKDHRECFTQVSEIIQLVQPQSFAVECVPLAEHLKEDLQVINSMLRCKPQVHHLDRYTAQRRIRWLWTNIKLDDEQITRTCVESAPLWIDCLSHAVPQLDTNGLPRRKSATLMASSNTYSDRNKSMWVHDIPQAMKLRPMTLDEKAKLVGIPSATLLMGNEQQKQRFLGNAVPVQFLQLLLKHFIPKWVLQSGPTTIQFHTDTIQPSTRVDNVCNSVQLVHAIDSYVVSDELHQRLLQAAAEDENYDDSAGLQSVDGRIAVPNDANLRNHLMHINHDLPTAGHPGQKRMLELMKRQYIWPGMSRDIIQYVENCRACQLAKPSYKRKSHLLQRMPSPTRPFTDIYCDLTTDLPLTTKGYDSVFVVVDKFTKMTIYIPTVKTATASMLVQLFLRHVVCH